MYGKYLLLYSQNIEFLKSLEIDIMVSVSFSKMYMNNKYPNI